MVTLMLISGLIIVGVVLFLWYNSDTEDQDDFRRNKEHYMRSQLK